MVGVALAGVLFAAGPAAAPLAPASSAISSSAPPPVAPTPANPRLKVGVVGSKPFVQEEDGRLGGLSVEVWRDVARSARVEYDLVPVPSVAEGIAETAHGALDVLVGPISITAERAMQVRFTQPYFQASLGILTRPAGSFWHRAAPFLSRTFFFGASSLLVVLLAVGTLLWIAERKRNPEMFPPSIVRGIGNGLWFALVTMTTVGYGDRVPVTMAGRILAGGWMVIAMITASSLTAGIATTLTLSQLDQSVVASADDLDGRRVGVVRGTVGAEFTTSLGARPVPFASLDAAIAALEKEQVLAVVHDRPALQYFLKSRADVELTLSRQAYEAQGYGFALKPTSPLLGPLNVALLEASESHRIERLSQRFLGK